MKTYNHSHKWFHWEGKKKIEQKYKVISSGSEIQNKQRIFTSTVVAVLEVPSHGGERKRTDLLCQA